MYTILAVGAGLMLAFANGANDNAKGVATLVGGRTMPAMPALWFAAATTLLGSLAALVFAHGLIGRFSGEGLVAAQVIGSSVFLSSVGTAAAVTVLLATRLGMPISTTHALVGGLAGTGLSAGALNGRALLGAFVVPLLVAPLLALLMAAAVYPVFRWARLRMGVSRRTCICIEREFHPVRVSADGTIVAEAAGVKLRRGADLSDCQERYEGTVAGVAAHRLLDTLHLLTAGATSFARGLNDTPKIAALVLAGTAVSGGVGVTATGFAIAAGGLLAARRVARTMSDRITGMNDGQAFTANLVTAFCVIVASRLGAPVSTTHVSCGSLFGIGMVNRQAHVGMIVQVLLAWLTTVPLAAAIGWLMWRVLGA